MDKPPDSWSDTFAHIATASIFAVFLAIIWLGAWKLILYPLWSWAT